MQLNKQTKFWITNAISFFVLILFFVSGSRVHAATLELSSGQKYSVGQVFSMAVLLATEGSESANAVSATVTFPNDKLQIISISKSNSIIDLWTREPSTSNAQGTAVFEGVKLNPGYAGSAGRIVTLTFKVLQPGSATLVFQNPRILANDGQGTDILSRTQGVTLQLVEAVPEPVKPQPVVEQPVPATTTSIETVEQPVPVPVVEAPAVPYYLIFIAIILIIILLLLIILLYIYLLYKEIRKEKKEDNKFKDSDKPQ
jgi:hypothetical protein